MKEERLRILEMIQNGKISASEGMELLDALKEESAVHGEGGKLLSGPSNLKNRLLVVKVNSASSKVNVNVPLMLLKATSKFVNMGMGLIPEEARREMESKGIDISKFDFEEFVNQLDQGLSDGKLVDVESVDPSGVTKVEVYVE